MNTDLDNLWLLKYIKDNNKYLNYFAIGAANNAKQQLPFFLLNYISMYDTRIIIIDPLVEDILDLIINYKESYYNKLWEINNIDCQDQQQSELPYEKLIVNNIIKIYKLYLPYKDNTIEKSIEIITIKKLLNYTENDYNNEDLNLIKNICDILITQDNILLGYDYSGYNIFILQNLLYKIFNYNDKFLENILLDISYGAHIGCFPNLDDMKPLLYNKDNKLKIINLVSQKLENYEKYILYIYSIIDNNIIINFENHIKYSIKYLIKKFIQNEYVSYRRLFDIKNNEFYKLIEDIYIFFNNIYNLLNIKLNKNEFINDITNFNENNILNVNKYNIFNKYIHIINNNIL
jgi:hypothetical protein